VTYDPKELARDAVEAAIDCSEVNTGVAKRDAQLKRADFFDVTRCPVMKFKSKRVEKMGDRLKVTGDLTIHATTQEMVLDVEGPRASVRDSRGNEKIGSSGMRRWNRVGLRSPMRSLSASILSYSKDRKTAVTP
jgi:polyisoprenoid-binding protein YceI